MSSYLIRRAGHEAPTPGGRRGLVIIGACTEVDGMDQSDSTDTATVAAASDATPRTIDLGPRQHTLDAGPYVEGDVRPPKLVELLTTIAEVDRLQLRAVGLTRALRSTGVVETATGTSLDTWLQLAGRMTGADRRTFRELADLLTTMPHLAHVVTEGRLSWSQLRTSGIRLRPLTLAQRAAVDLDIAAEAITTGDCEPEVFVRNVDLLIAEVLHLTEEAAEDRAAVGNRLILQPRLDHTGGRIIADYDAPTFAGIAEAIADRMGRPDGLEPSDRDADAPGTGAASDRNRDRIGAAQAEALAAICADSLAGHTTDGTTVPARPAVLVTLDADTLLGADDKRARLLTTMMGGELHVTSRFARQLLDRGCDVRLIVNRGGHTVGVGRAQRFAPGWLRDVVLTQHATCVYPGCRMPARRCDIDHADNFHNGGRTDADQLSPLCRRHHTMKTRGTISLSPADANGDRFWTHHRSGLTTRIPADTVRHRPPLAQPPHPPPPTAPFEEPTLDVEPARSGADAR